MCVNGKAFIGLLFIVFNIKSYSQHNLNGKIISDNQIVSYALIYSESNERPVYSDSLGFFKLDKVNVNEIITVKCVGYEEKRITIKSINEPLKIELQKVDNLLDEIVIQVINSTWQQLFKKPKPHLWPTSIGLVEGFSAITKYKVINNVKFNGIAFISKNSSEEYKVKKMRLLIFKKNINPTNSLIESEVKTFNIPKNNSGKLNRKDYRLEFVFNNIIELKKDEEIYIGLEFIPNTIENINLKDIIMLATVKEMNNPNLDTKLHPFLFYDSFRGNYYKEVPLNEDLYFELKVVK